MKVIISKDSISSIAEAFTERRIFNATFKKETNK